MADKNKTNAPSVTHLSYYFDSEQRDQKDLAQKQARMGQWYLLRQKLLNLPEDSFDKAMGACLAITEQLKEEAAPKVLENKKKQQEKQQLGQLLRKKPKE